jgi:hypothetical protein
MRLVLLVALLCGSEAWISKGRHPIQPLTPALIRLDIFFTETIKRANQTNLVQDGKLVEMVLQDKTFQFHSMWLRDACRDDNNIALKAGERKLIAMLLLLMSDRRCLPWTQAVWRQPLSTGKAAKLF